MPRLIKRGRIVDDATAVVTDATADIPAGPAIVPLATWQAQREALLARGDVGVWLAPADDPLVLEADIERLALIAVEFPKFSDGRGYSTARLLRDRLGYRGELRAIGDVQRDQLYYLSQVGFDAFAVAHDRDLEVALAGLRDFSDGYQITQARTPWFRRREGASA